MVDWIIMERLMKSFNQSFINVKGEFIAHLKANQYISLKECTTEFDVKYKVLEWFSRSAYKSEPFGKNENTKFHKFMLNGINSFLNTNFDSSDMESIYTYLGNSCNHEKTKRFIESGYDIKILK